MSKRGFLIVLCILTPLDKSSWIAGEKKATGTRRLFIGCYSLFRYMGKHL